MSAFFTKKKAGKELEMKFKILNSPFAFPPRNNFLFSLKEKPVH